MNRRVGASGPPSPVPSDPRSAVPPHPEPASQAGCPIGGSRGSGDRRHAPGTGRRRCLRRRVRVRAGGPDPPAQRRDPLRQAPEAFARPGLLYRRHADVFGDRRGARLGRAVDARQPGRAVRRGLPARPPGRLRPRIPGVPGGDGIRGRVPRQHPPGQRQERRRHAGRTPRRPAHDRPRSGPLPGPGAADPRHDRWDQCRLGRRPDDPLLPAQPRAQGRPRRLPGRAGPRPRGSARSAPRGG